MDALRVRAVFVHRRWNTLSPLLSSGWALSPTTPPPPPPPLQKESPESPCISNRSQSAGHFFPPALKNFIGCRGPGIQCRKGERLWGGCTRRSIPALVVVHRHYWYEP